MPLDPEKLAPCREWLAKAAPDLRSALLQCGEKTLKAFLAWHEVPFRKTHNLDELGSQYLAIDATLEHVIREAGALTAYGRMYRYPGGSEIEPGPKDAEEAYCCSSDTLRAFLARLPAEVIP
jgi:hypothetical protein